MTGRTAGLLLPVLLLPFLVDKSWSLPPSSPADTAWQVGQAALERDQLETAIGQFQLSLRLDPTLMQAHLSLAAAYLARGEEELALPHLARYVRARPNHLSVRAHHADLLLRMGRRDEAREQFERLVVDVQGRDSAAENYLVHCHTRLMEIAQQAGDDYSVHLHRGIGLYHLGCRHGELSDSESQASAEDLLCRAAAELTLARLNSPDRVRPCWYLHVVWDRLAQQPPARRWLRLAAEADDPLSDLTPVERRDLLLARRQLEDGPRKK